MQPVTTNGEAPYLEGRNCLVISLYQGGVIPYIRVVTLQKWTTLNPYMWIFYLTPNKTDQAQNLLCISSPGFILLEAILWLV